ncbi:MAG: hypothetical protein ACRDZO_26955 [Egibacteraceae bacterium]
MLSWRRLGSEATVLQRGPPLIPTDDAERQFAREGIDLRFNTEATSVGAEGAGKV